VDSSSGHFTLKLGQVKKYNTYAWFGTWDVDVSLSNHVKNKFKNSLPYLFTLSTLIILLVIVFILINFHYLLILVIHLIHSLSGVIIALILEQQGTRHVIDARIMTEECLFILKTISEFTYLAEKQVILDQDLQTMTTNLFR